MSIANMPLQLDCKTLPSQFARQRGARQSLGLEALDHYGSLRHTLLYDILFNYYFIVDIIGSST